MPQATMRRQYPAVTSRGPTSTTRPCSERSASGRRANATRSVKHAPAPGSLRTVRVPPIMPASWRAIDRPSPVPP